MSEYQYDAQPYGQAGVQRNQALRSYMQGVYGNMFIGLVITALSSFFVATASITDGGLTSFGQFLFMSPMKWVVMFAPLAVVLFMSFRMNSLSVSTARTLFWAYAFLNGVSFATIFMVFSGATITRAFLITAILFGSMSIYGYVTKRDLTSMGSFLIMGVWGIFIAGLVNLFLQSSAMQFILSFLSVIIFTGLTAYDTQKIRDLYYQVGEDETGLKRVSILGALTLYIDFIAIFINLLQLMRGGSDE